MSYDATIAALSPLDYLTFSDASGAAATDSSGNSRPGVYQATPTLGAAGMITGDSSTAVTLNGTSQYVSLAGGSYMAVTDYTLILWLKFTSSGTMVLIGWGASATTNRVVELSNISNLLTGVFYNSSGSGTNVSGATANDGKRHCVGLRKNGTSISIWIDGVQAGSATATVRGGINTELDIGRRAGAAFFTAGTLQKFAMFGSALSDADMQSIYAAGVTAGGTASGLLGGFTGSASGVRTEPGSATGNLGSIGGTASGLRSDVGTAAGSLGNVHGQAIPGGAVAGTATGTLGAVVGAASGTRIDVGSANGQIGGFTGAATGVRIEFGTAAGTLGSIDGQAVGSVPAAALIDGSSTQTLASQYEAMTVQSDGNDWWIVG